MNPTPSDHRESGFELGDDSYDANRYSMATGSEATPAVLASRVTWWRWPLIPIAAPHRRNAWLAPSGCHPVVRHENVRRVLRGWLRYCLYVMPLNTSGVFGWLWCYISSSLAPRGRTITGAAMATVLAMLGVFLILVSFAQLERTRGPGPRHSIGGAIAAIAWYDLYPACNDGVVDHLAPRCAVVIRGTREVLDECRKSADSWEL